VRIELELTSNFVICSIGSLHGFQEKFYGIAIIFDTFKNTEHLSAHRDVTVMINDGEKTFEMMTEDIQGCNTNIRYHSERADFSVLDSTRAKVVVNGSRLSVQIDSKGNGNWVSCVDIPNVNLKEGWLQNAHVGFTGIYFRFISQHTLL